MRAGLQGLVRGHPRKVTGVPQPPGPTPVSFLQEVVLPGNPTGALLASGLSLCLAAFVLLLVTLEPGDETSGIPSLSASYADTVAAPSRVSCRI